MGQTEKNRRGTEETNKFVQKALKRASAMGQCFGSEGTLLLNALPPPLPLLLSSFVHVNFLSPTRPQDYLRGWGRWTHGLHNTATLGCLVELRAPNPSSISAFPLRGLCWKPLQCETLLLWGKGSN